MGKKESYPPYQSKTLLHTRVHIADVTEPILGADFFITNNLTIDMSRRRLISMTDLAIPTRSTCQSPSVTGIHMPSINAANLIITEFPSFSLAKGIGQLSCTRRYFNGIVLIVEIINQVIQNYNQRRATFRLVRAFIKHAYELYEALITFIQLVYTFHSPTFTRGQTDPRCLRQY